MRIVRLNFWDVAGDDVYFEIRNEFYKDTNSAILVYDVTDRSSFLNLDKWMQELMIYCKTPVSLYLVGNKTDGIRFVTTEEGQELAKKLECK